MRSPTRRARARSWVTTTAVTPRSFWIELSSLPIVAEVVGSRPVVGSSKSTTSGSRASERARATRLRMPPERSEGNLRSTSFRFTLASFWRTVSAISDSDSSVCSRRGKATLSITFMESNRAPLWKSMAIRRRSGKSSCSSSSESSTPSKVTVPASGFSRPLSCRRVTLLPLPDLPRMTRHSPRRTSRSRPPRTVRLPYFLTKPRIWYSASGTGFPSGKDIEKLREEEIGDQDQDRGEHHRVGRRPAHAVRAALGVEAIVAPDNGDKVRKEKGLGHAAPHVAEVERVEDVVEIEPCRQVQSRDGDDQAAQDAQGVADDGEGRQHDQ